MRGRIEMEKIKNLFRKKESYTDWGYIEHLHKKGIAVY